MEEKLDINNILKLDKQNLDENIIKLGELYHSILKKCLKNMKKINELECEFSEKQAEKYSYYKCDYDIQLSSQEIKIFIEGDKDLLEIKKQLLNLKSENEFLEKELKNIEGTRWDAKNLIDYMKLKAGLF